MCSSFIFVYYTIDTYNWQGTDFCRLFLHIVDIENVGKT